MKKLGEKLRELRKEHGYTLRELGDKLNMSFSILAMYERGERTPPVDKLVLLANFFGVSTDYLLGKVQYRNYPGGLLGNVVEHIKNNKIKVGKETRKKLLEIPVFYNILNSKEEAAGEECQQYRVVSRNNLEDGNYFYLRVNDDSLSGSRIRSGDLVLVRETTEVGNGDIALVYIGGRSKNGRGDKILIRRIYFKGRQVILEPDNKDFEPVIIGHKNVEVKGKVIRVEFDL